METKHCYITKLFKLDGYLANLLLLLFTCINSSAQGEVRKCYEVSAPPSVNGQVAGSQYCIFAWRLSPGSKPGEYILDTTAGLGNSKYIEFKNDKFISARGPAHNGQDNKPEWFVSNLDDKHQIWRMIAFGVEIGNKILQKDVMCVEVKPDDPAYVDFKKGCYTYNYDEFSSKRRGYISIPGFTNGGPISQERLSSAFPDSCATTPAPVVDILTSGHGCTSSGEFYSDDSVK